MSVQYYRDTDIVEMRCMPQVRGVPIIAESRPSNKQKSINADFSYFMRECNLKAAHNQGCNGYKCLDGNCPAELYNSAKCRAR